MIFGYFRKVSVIEAPRMTVGGLRVAEIFVVIYIRIPILQSCSTFRHSCYHGYRKAARQLSYCFYKKIQNIVNIGIRLIFIPGHKLLLKTHCFIDLET